MTDSEKKLLIALARMVQQYLREYGDEVDSLAESAGEHAIEALAHFGLMESVNTRFGRWTEAGKQFLEDAGIHDPEPMDYPGRMLLVGKSEPKE
jgi:hypothetical protein